MGSMGPCQEETARKPTAGAAGERQGKGACSRPLPEEAPGHDDRASAYFGGSLRTKASRMSMPTPTQMAMSATLNEGQ